MPAVEVNHIAKSFAGKAAVVDLSFSVNQGEVFGLIGPNGAGKTTTIRMMMDIIKPDSGQITILGEKLSESSKNKLGLPAGRKRTVPKAEGYRFYHLSGFSERYESPGSGSKGRRITQQDRYAAEQKQEDRRAEQGHGADHPVHHHHHP